MKRIFLILCTAGITLYAQQPPSWEMTGETATNVTRVYDIVETPSGVLIAGVRIGGGTTYSIFRSTDGGNTWTNVLTGPSSATYCSDLEVTPSGRIYAALVQWYNYSSVWIYYSDDDGVTWTELPQPRIPLGEVFNRAGDPVGIKYDNGVLYVFGRSQGYYQGPLFHGEVWYYTEATGKWAKWDLVNLNAQEGGWTIEIGPGPSAGNYLYLGTYSTGTVIRSQNPVSLLNNNSKKIKNIKIQK